MAADTPDSDRVDTSDTRLSSPWLHVWDDDQAVCAATAGRVPASLPPRERMGPGKLAPWWRAGARAAALRPVTELEALDASPLVLGGLALGVVLANLLWEGLAMGGPATFDWRALASGWLDWLVLAWLCAWVRPPVVGAARVFALTVGLQFVMVSVMGPLWVILAHAAWQPPPAAAYWVGWALWGLPQLWWLLAMAVLLRRLGDGHRRPWLLAVLVLLGLQALHWVAPGPRAWTPASRPTQEERPVLSLTETVLQAQATLLERQLAALAPQRPGVVDVYVVTFAPYGDEDVFSRESAMVAEVMSRRFDAQGRVLQLVNHPASAERLPWATSANLAQALKRLSQVMDPQEDIVFIHLTSHGARNGHLAAGLWPLQPEAVTPGGLKGWLDTSGIRRRIVSISACYSGSWIAPLANHDSLVMTAADADHTSYGCGRLSPLTFFGRALYDEQLRGQTLSFTEAHAAAREVIRQREIDGGKDDGYSNPQISMGVGIAPVLEALRARLAPAGPGVRPAAAASPR